MTFDLSKTLSDALSGIVERERQALRAFPEDTASGRPGGEGTWSPKEELGHLIDSAANNHVRFVRAAIEPEFRGPTYAQDDWVRLHNYQNMPWLAIVAFWAEYNTFLASLVSHIPGNKLDTLCFIGAGDGVSLRFLIEDYMLHLQHHLDHLLQREHVTKYPA